jgi:hypothetical protein
VLGAKWELPCGRQARARGQGHSQLPGNRGQVCALAAHCAALRTSGFTQHPAGGRCAAMRDVRCAWQWQWQWQWQGVGVAGGGGSLVASGSGSGSGSGSASSASASGCVGVAQCKGVLKWLGGRFARGGGFVNDQGPNVPVTWIPNPLALAACCVIMAGCRITPVLVFWTLPDLHWVKFTSETGFELPSSWSNLPCYGVNPNRNILDFMK